MVTINTMRTRRGILPGINVLYLYRWHVIGYEVVAHKIADPEYSKQEALKMINAQRAADRKAKKTKAAG